MKNPNLDFADFAATVIKQVDDIRSFGTTSSSDTVESRINAFYRLLGLPSALPPDGKSAFDQYNTGNKFKAGNVRLNSTSLILKQSQRENGYKGKVEIKEAKSFIHNNKNKLNDGVEGKRKRGPLFPMVVFSEIPIFPQENRVADAFFNENDIVKDGIRYRRPFIEAVILMRLKGEGSIDAGALQRLKDDLDVEVNNLNVLETNLVRGLTNSVHTIISKMTEVTKTINEISTALSSYNIPKSDLIAEAQQEFSNDPDVEGAAEQRKKRLDAQERVKNAFLFSLEYSDTEDGTKNVKDIPLVSGMLSMLGQQLTTDGRNATRNTVSKDKKEVEAQEKKLKAQARRAFRDLEFLLGTFSGLSGVDIMVIINALFQLELRHLVGLLNSDAQKRLRTLKGNNIAASSASEALDELENKVTQIYKKIVDNSGVTKHKEKIPGKKDDS